MINRGFDGLRHPDAASLPPATGAGFDALANHKYCLLVTYRRSGEPVATPVWFGPGAADLIYVRSEAELGKVKRIRNDPRVEVAACTARGKPLQAAAPGRARRILE